MHFRTLCAATLVVVLPSVSAQSDLILTGVMDGPLTGGVPKVIEVYALDDIPDLSVYGFGSANNGGGSDGQEFTFPSEPATSGEYIRVSTGIGMTPVGMTAFFGFDADYVSNAVNINGDDAIELYMGGSIVDIYGDPNVDGTGEPWEYNDGFAYRRDNATPSGSVFEFSSWIVVGPDNLNGATSNGNNNTPFVPFGTFSSDPASVVVVQSALDVQEGWRLLSLPVTGYTVEDLAALDLVQGVTGQYPTAPANLFTEYNPTTTLATDPNYVAAASVSTVVPPGRGFWWYMYNNNGPPAPDLPNPDPAFFGGGSSLSYTLAARDLWASGPPLTADETVTLPNSLNGFYMIGNPFDQAIPASAVTYTGSVGSSLQDDLQAWDPSGNQFVNVSRVSGGELAVWQGVFAEVTGETGPAQFNLDYDARLGPASTPVFYGRRSADRIRLALDGTLTSGVQVSDRMASVRLVEGAEVGWDRFDSSKLLPPSSAYALLAVVGERDGESRRQSAFSLSSEWAGSIDLPIDFLTTEAGDFTIGVEGMEALPSGWSLDLLDRVTGVSTSLSDGGIHTFTAAATDWADRFVLTLSSASVAVDDGGRQLSVGDIYPNPSSAGASLPIQLATLERVTVSIYDALGRRIETVLDEPLEGSKSILLDSDSLAPGIYMVRVDGETFSTSRRLVIAR